MLAEQPSTPAVQPPQPMQPTAPIEKQTVKVALRFRPLKTPTLAKSKTKSCVAVYPTDSQVVLTRQEDRRAFSFDNVFSSETPQSEIYDSCCQGMVDMLLEGYNVTVLAYGQTGSGKTHTIIGNDNMELDSTERAGIIPRAVNEIFEKLQTRQQTETGVEYAVYVSGLEIYQETVRDLLVSDGNEIPIREDKGGNIIAQGVHEQQVSNVEELMRCVENGLATRVTADNQVHLHSSRSHAVLTITLEQRIRTLKLKNMASRPSSQDTLQNDNYDQAEYAVLRRSKFQLVDLAGSERIKKTHAEGVRLKESVKINSGLLALGNVISCLAIASEGGNSGSPIHVPYRNSKLTRLLADSLGGNARTVMIACASPAEDDYDETLNTLQYAARARKIQNKPVINTVDNYAVAMAAMKQRIDSLEGQLKTAEEVKLQAKSPSRSTQEQLEALKLMEFEKLKELGDEGMLQYFIDELKTRTIRGTNAVQVMRKAQMERDEAQERNTGLEIRLQETELILAQSTAQSQETIKTCENLSWQLNECHGDICRTFQILFELVGRGAVSTVLENELRNIVDKWGADEQRERMMAMASLTLAPAKVAQKEKSPTKATNAPADNAPSTDKRSQWRQRRLERQPPSVQISQLQQTVQQQQEAIQSLENEIANTKNYYESEKSVLVKKVTEAQSQMEAIRNENVRLQAEFRFLQPQTSRPTTADASKRDELPVVPSASSENLNANLSNTNTNMNDRPDSQMQMQSFDEAAGIAVLESMAEPELRQVLQKTQQDLSQVMRARVELVRELNIKNKEAEKAKHEFTERINKTERELEHAQREYAKLKTEFDEKDSNIQKIRDEYERKIKTLETQVTRFKTRQKEHDKMLKDKEFSDRKIVDLQGELEKTGQQVSALKKKMKEETEKHSEVETRLTKDINHLRRKADEDTKKITQLIKEQEVTRKKLDRKTEETRRMTMTRNGSAASLASSGMPPLPPSMAKHKSGSALTLVGNNSNDDDIKELEAAVKTFDERLVEVTSALEVCEESDEQADELRQAIEKLQIGKRRKLERIKMLKEKISGGTVAPGTFAATVSEEITQQEEPVEGGSKMDATVFAPIMALLKDDEKFAAILDDPSRFSIPEIQTCLVDYLCALRKSHAEKTLAISNLTKQIQQKDDESRSIIQSRLEELGTKYEGKISQVRQQYEMKLNDIEKRLKADTVKENNDDAVDKEKTTKKKRGDSTSTICCFVQTEEHFPDNFDEILKDLKFYQTRNKELKGKLKEFVESNDRICVALKEEKMKAYQLTTQLEAMKEKEIEKEKEMEVEMEMEMEKQKEKEEKQKEKEEKRERKEKKKNKKTLVSIKSDDTIVTGDVFATGA